jgi:DNA-binding protein
MALISQSGRRAGIRDFIKISVFVLIALALIAGTLAPMQSPVQAAPSEKVQNRGQLRLRTQFEFEDVDEDEWEFGYVAEMKGKGVIKGYEDGTFRPNASISQAEALAMVLRALGLEKEAKDPVPDDIKIPGLEAAKWASNYINLGLNLKIIDSSDFQPNKAASRGWVTALMVSALESQDLDESDGEWAAYLEWLEDLADIPAGLKSSIGKALAKGLITGYPDKTFKPNKPVTRAEMAALLSRFDVTLPFPTNPYEVRGRVTAVGRDSITIEHYTRANYRHRVRAAGSKAGQQRFELGEKTYGVSEDALILKNGKAAKLSDITVGDDVRMLLNDDDTVIMIIAQKSMWWEVKGEVIRLGSSPDKGITLAVRVYDEDDDDYTLEERSYKVSADVRVEYKDKVVGWSDIAVGDIVQMRLSGDLVVAIKILPGYHVINGTVKTAPGDSLKMVVKDEDGKDISIDVSVTAVVKYKTGNDLKLEDIMVDDEVKVTMERGSAVIIEIKERAEEEPEDHNEETEVSGEVTGITRTAKKTWIIVKDDRGRSVRYLLSADVEIEIDYEDDGDKEGTTDDIAIGDEVALTLEDGVVTEVVVTKLND